MDIIVYAPSTFWGDRVLRSDLAIFLSNTHTGADWRDNPWNCQIPVSEELFEQVLGASHRPCPHVGEAPERGIRASYRIGNYGIDENRTLEQCSVCGFETDYPGHWRGQWAIYGGYPGEGHPSREYFGANQQYSTVSEADWDTETSQLTVATKAGTLIVWVKKFHFRKDGAIRDAKKRFPQATVVADMNRFLVLCQAE